MPPPIKGTVPGPKVAGVIGPPGIQGENGEDGQLGPPGAAGVTGATGATGAPGVMGPLGPQGEEGDEGQLGPPGAAGVDGAPGSPGTVGPVGMRGFDGEDGEDGQPGVPGRIGVDGTPGATGPIGISGEEGDEGPMGPPGAAGVTGAQGIQGDPGIAGAPGEDGQPGPPGIPGSTGPQGPAGMGVPGVDGEDGADAPPGPAGVAGPEGSPGSPGSQGIQGVPGISGDDGEDGQPGSPGIAGPPGEDGPAGVAGPQGPAGMGIPGVDGEDGADAPPGPAGATGPVDWQMVENNPLLLAAALTADGKYSGIVEAGIAGATLVFGNLCYLAVADSRWEKADANTLALANAKLGICVLAAAADGSVTTMLLWGKVNAAGLYPALTIGAKVFVGETAGNIQVAAPTADTDIIRVIGYANTADELFFCPNDSLIDIIDDTAGGNDAAIYKAASANVVYDHGALTTAHGAVSTATASKMVVRDASGRAAFAAPAAAGDALIKGTALTSTEVSSAISGVAKIVRKAADETVNNSATLQDSMTLAVAANEVWLIKLVLVITSVSTASDFKMGFAYPTGCSIRWGVDAGIQADPNIYPWLACVVGNSPKAITTETGTFAVGSANLTYGIKLTAIIVNGATAGNVNFQWAQNTATAEDTKLLANSCMIAHKIA